MREKNNILFFLGLLVPALLAFKALFLPGPLAWGDAPYFYPEGLQEFLSEPYGWINRGHNFGGINNILWLSPVMFLYGALHALFGLGNDVIVRILFYFPAVLLAFVGPILFARYLGYSRVVQFFASFIYTFNTYYLLIIDGGQVGVALAYGLFPLTLLYLIKLSDKPDFRNFYKALVLLLLLLIFDVRIAAIAAITLFFWLGIHALIDKKVDFSALKLLVVIFIAAGTFTAYWLYPTLKLGFSSIELSSTMPLALVSLLDSLTLFQPHWPENIFGKISTPPFYFVGVPLLIFAGLLFKKEVLGVRRRKAGVFALLFLLFAFLAKGTGEPLGQTYDWLVSTFSFGFAFRDSTKFFIPLLLFGGVLIGQTADRLVALLKKRITPLHNSVTPVIYLYLLLLVHPAILGDLNGVLAGRTLPSDFQIVHNNLVGDSGFFRVAWFPDRHPFSFLTEEKPGLDTKRLVEVRPLASLNVGTFDAFNFLHKPEFLDWFDVLGIKYLVFSGDARNPKPSSEQQEDWEGLLAFVDEVDEVEWGTSFPVYKTPSTKPRIFAVDKVIGVIGGENIYQKIRSVEPNFSVGNQGFVFFEDGKLDPQLLRGLEKEDAVLVFNEKEDLDLQMSFLQKYLVGPGEAYKNEWAKRGSNEYLKWKYEFLNNGIKTLEFDYAKGISFSTIPGEEISWELPVPEDGDYVLAVRRLVGGVFSWDKKDVSLTEGTYPLTLTNDKEFAAVNVVALISKKEWEEAGDLVRQFTGHFPVVKLDGVEGIGELEEVIDNSQWQEVGYDTISPVRYKIVQPEKTTWIVFSENYHPLWKMQTGPDLRSSVPFYSAINGYYLKPDWRDPVLVFEGQKSVRWGFYYTGLTLLSLAFAFFWFYPTRDGKK